MTEKSGYSVIYAASIFELCDDKVYDAFFKAASVERKKKTESLKLISDKKLSLLSETLLKMGLLDFGINMDSLSYKRDLYGKPHVIGSNGVEFSISHSGDWAVCAVSGSDIGCDVEIIGNAPYTAAKRFFTSSEYEYLMNLETEVERINTFYRIWTLKESYTKAVGTGLSTPLNSFNIIIGDAGVCVEQQELTQHFYFKEFDKIPGYMCSVCSVNSPYEGEFRVISATEALKSIK